MRAGQRSGRPKGFARVFELVVKGRWEPLKDILSAPEQSPIRGGLKIALIYAVVGVLWIVLFDLAVDSIFGQSKAALASENVKGWFFVAASALLVYLLTSRTISSIKESRRALSDSQLMLSAFIQNFPGMVYRCGGDVDCPLDFVSPGAVELTGYPIGELKKKHRLSDLVLEEDRETIRSEMEIALAGRLPFRLIYRIRAADGGIKWVWEQGLGIYSKSGQLTGIEGIVADITGRKRIEEALRRSEEVYKVLAEGTSEAIFMVDDNRDIVSVNSAFLDLFGFSREEIMGQSVRKLHPSDESFIDFGNLAQATLKGSPLRVEWELKKKDGTVFPVEGTFTAIKRPEGAMTGHVGIIRDITARKKAEKQLREYREHLEEMVYARTRELREAQAALVQREKLKTLGAASAELAHEIRNPLVSIGGFARRMLKKYPDSAEAEIIVRETERLETMLNRLRNYLQPVDMNPRECHVNEILSDSLALLGPELERDEVKIQMNLYPGLPTAHVDPEILAQVFIAVIRNAVGMMDREKEIAIKTYYGEHSVYVDMTSHVAVNKPWDPEHMLMPFEASGEGIDISSTFKLLEEMGGALSFSKLDSKAVFTVSLIKCPGAGHGEMVQQRQRA
ncbi:MAG TPA: PAS domain S-box protein [Syntrophobacteraceae bacterium]|nr:PAS domain S-box protein [Syntrophobacteraceae bacterium]